MKAPARYRRIYPRLWSHPGYQGLKRLARELAIYVLAGPQSNGIGLFKFSPATAAEDLGAGVETIREGLGDVLTTFGWFYDADARVLFIPSWWRFNPPENPNVLRGLLKLLNELPPSNLVEAFAENLETLPPTLRETFVEHCRERLGQRSRKQDQDQFPGSGTRTGSGAHPNGNALPMRSENGSDGGVLLTKAREVLKLTNPNAPMEHLIDSFRSIAPNLGSRTDVVSAINRALIERRGAA